MCSASSSLRLSELLPAVQSFNASFRARISTSVTNETVVLRDMISTSFEALDDDFSSLSPVMVQECLSFLTFTSDTQAAERVMKFAVSAFEVIKLDAPLLKKFVRDAGGNFRPERFSLHPLTEQLALSESEECSAPAKLYFRSVVKYLSAVDDLVEEDFDLLNFSILFRVNLLDGYERYSLFRLITKVFPLYPKNSRVSFLKTLATFFKKFQKAWMIVLTVGDNDFHDLLFESIQQAVDEGEERAYWARFLVSFEEFLQRDMMQRMKWKFPEVDKLFEEGKARATLSEKMVLLKLKDIDFLVNKSSPDFESLMRTAYHSLVTVIKLYPDVHDNDISLQITEKMLKVAEDSNGLLRFSPILQDGTTEYPLLLNIMANKFLSHPDFNTGRYIFNLGCCSRIGRAIKEYSGSETTKDALSKLLTPENRKEMIDLLFAYFQSRDIHIATVKDAINLGRFLKHCGVSSQKLKMFGNLILPTVSWFDEDLLRAAASQYFEGTSSEGYSAVVLKKLKTANSPQAKKEIKKFLQVCEPKNIFSQTELEFFNFFLF